MLWWSYFVSLFCWSGAKFRLSKFCFWGNHAGKRPVTPPGSQTTGLNILSNRLKTSSRLEGDWRLETKGLPVSSL